MGVMMENYDLFYNRLMKTLKTYPFAIALIKSANRLISKLMAAVYLILLAYLFFNQKNWFPFLLFPGVSFCLMTILRKVLNQPRPYETWAIEPLILKETRGHSMPSRHVFSATLISICVLRVHLLLGLCLLVLSTFLGFCRIAAGLHYPKDVLVGFFLGLFSGGLLFAIPF